MCLAVPARVVSIEGVMAETEVGGVTRSASLLFVPQAKVGDYVIVHAGFAIQLLDRKEAKETLELLAEMAQAADEATRK